VKVLFLAVESKKCILCWVCVIFFARVVVSERLHWVCGGSGAAPPNFFFWVDIISPVSSRHIIAGPTYFRDDIFPGPHDIRWFSSHGFC
jgi:hypothetical protein